MDLPIPADAPVTSATFFFRSAFAMWLSFEFMAGGYGAGSVGALAGGAMTLTEDARGALSRRRSPPQPPRSGGAPRAAGRRRRAAPPGLHGRPPASGWPGCRSARRHPDEPP